MIDMVDLNPVANVTIKNEVIFKPINSPGADSVELSAAKPPQPAETGVGGKRFERLISCFDDAHRGIGIVLGDEIPNFPQFFLDTGIKNKFRHQDGMLLSVCGVG